MQNIMSFIVAMHTRVTEISEKDRGATATEYALLVAFIALAIIIGVTAFGSQLNAFFSALSTRVGLF